VYRLEKSVGDGVMMIGKLDDGPFQIGEDRIIGTYDLKINGHALLYRRMLELLDNAVSVWWFCDTTERL
jgi:hypothetical protein